jgi:hypothetical protein
MKAAVFITRAQFVPFDVGTRSLTLFRQMLGFKVLMYVESESREKKCYDYGRRSLFRIRYIYCLVGKRG